MDTLELTLRVGPELQDACVAELIEFGAEGFLQEDDRLRAYLPAASWSAAVRRALERRLEDQGLPGRVDVRTLPEQDWDARWRDRVRPVAVGRFLIRPTWSETPPEHAHREVIEIDPKMSFGTGRHETTRLMLRLLERRAPLHGRVLDAGSGSGILAVAAVRLGAESVVAFDVDPATRRDAGENLARNGVADRVAFRIGSIEEVPESGFDLILANIVRPVILDLLPAFAAKLRPSGALLVSGILTAERDEVCAAAATCGFSPVDELREEAWWAAALAFRTPSERTP